MKDLLKKSDGSFRIDLDQLYFPFVEKLFNVLQACRERGQDYYPIYGYRSWALQHQLRMKFLNGTGGRAAPAGDSAHNYGLAVDVAADSDMKRLGLQPSWEEKKYAILGEETKKAGLVWGGGFNDMPHVQWPGYVSGKDMAVLRKIWKASEGADEQAKLQAIWQYLDALSGK